MGGRLYAPYEKDIKQIMTVCTHCVLSNVNFEVLSFLKIGFLASQLCVEYFAHSNNSFQICSYLWFYKSTGVTQND